MGILARLKRRRPKPTTRLPYTYEAWVDILGGQGNEPVHDHYFSATLCGLLETLVDEGIGSDHVQLYGVHRRRHYPLATEILTQNDGRWLLRPALCRKLEEHYEQTREERYRGHVEGGKCSFADRDRRGSGPVW